MNSYNLSNYMKKGLLIVLAGCLIGVGVGTILYANIGGDTITVFQDGMHSSLNISYGQASRLYNIVLIIIALVFAREYFGIGTIISALITGYAIDFTFDMLSTTNINTNFFIALFIFLIGQTIYALALSILISCKLGMNSLDSIIYKLIEYLKIDYKIIRFVADLILTLLGYILGGVVGLGTIISIISTGWMIDTFVKLKGEKE